ncbi:MAG: Sec-independent protein translocase protein TatB [Pseudomonadales bacterium]
MLDIGFTELLLIAIVALVVLGPEKLPVAVRTLGLWIGKAKRTISGIQSEISEELRLDEMKRTAAVAKEQLDSELEQMKTPFISDDDIEKSNAENAREVARINALNSPSDESETASVATETQQDKNPTP